VQPELGDPQPIAFDEVHGAVFFADAPWPPARQRMAQSLAIKEAGASGVP
jgi:hypothetical protein